jgi:PAS domain S-box-containing protein
MTVAFDNENQRDRSAMAGVSIRDVAAPWMVGDGGYRCMLERIPGIVYAVAPDAPGRMLYVSPQSEVLLGYTAGEWLQDPGFWQRAIYPEDCERVLAAHAEAHAGRRSLACEYRMLARSGRVVWLSDVCAPVLDGEGRLLYMQGLLLDVTERRHAEAEIREWHEEMERLVELQVAAQTAAAIAHELNQPLNAIATYTTAALRLLRAGNPQPERLQHALEQGAEQVQRAGRSMRDLLALLHKGETPTEGVYLNAAVREAVSILVADGYIDGVKAVVELTPDLPRVRANRLQVQKVLVNLLRNAVEAIHGCSRARGVVTVRTDVAEGMARVCVEDDGPGLDPQTAQRVFEPFFTTKAHGIGMGLAISRALILAHGGRMWVESAVPHGCRFCFTLLLAE